MLRFAYKRFQTHRPVWALQNVYYRPQPALTVSLPGPKRTYVNRALLVTGSDDAVFPETAAHQAGIDLSSAPLGESWGIGSVRTPIRFAEVTLRISDGKEHRQWIARVGFTPIPLRRPLLGFAGFLQFFTATFRGDREKVELEVNTIYRGT